MGLTDSIIHVVGLYRTKLGDVTLYNHTNAIYTADTLIRGKAYSYIIPAGDSVYSIRESARAVSPMQSSANISFLTFLDFVLRS